MATHAPQKDLDIGTIGLVAAVGTLVVLLTVILLQAYYYKTEDRAFQEAYAQPVLEVKRVKSEQLQLLQGTAAVPGDPAKSTIRISIDRAMELVVREGAHAWPAPAAAPAEKPPAGR